VRAAVKKKIQKKIVSAPGKKYIKGEFPGKTTAGRQGF